MIVRYIQNNILPSRRCARHGIMVHRCGVDKQTGHTLALTGPEFIAAFSGGVPEASNIVGGTMPYTFVIGGPTDANASNGVVWQCLPIDVIGWHGRRCSSEYIGVGVVGDFRFHEPTTAQWDSLVDLCSDLSVAVGFPPPKVIGHGEARSAHDGTKAPGKPGACPGAKLNLDELRREVTERCRSAAVTEARKRLEAAGVRL